LDKLPELRFDGTPVELGPDWNTLKSPRRFDHEATVLIDYIRLFQPPLTVMSASECDAGDLVIRIRYRVETEISESIFYFAYQPGGRLAVIPRVRDVPSVNDARIDKLHKQGLLTSGETERLLNYPAGDRYRVARSDNTTSNYLDIPDTHRDLLRDILRSRLTAERTTLVDLQETVSQIVQDAEELTKRILAPVVSASGERFDYKGLENRLYAAIRRADSLRVRVHDEQLRTAAKEFLDAIPGDDWMSRSEAETEGCFSIIWDRFTPLNERIGELIRSL